MKILTIFGTRPEAVKMCPLIIELKKNANIEAVVCLTGQHREMLMQVMEAFDVVADYNIDIMSDVQTLSLITTSILTGLEEILKKEAPDMVLVHGDTTTSFAASLAAFYQKIPVGHVEAGLRTYDKYSPFPEEINRQLTDRIAQLLFAPTDLNRNNLEAEGITSGVYVTGNTVIDAFKYTISDNYEFENEKLQKIDFVNKKVILLTAHRRENLGRSLEEICDAVKNVAESHRDVLFVYPVHLNPKVRETVFDKLGEIKNVLLLDPINVFDMHNLMSRCYLVMTDSGGLQEEAPHFGKPVLVLRNETERPEAVEAGTVKVIGTTLLEIVNSVDEILNDSKVYETMSKAVNPYGDGHASEKIIQILLEHLE